MSKLEFYNLHRGYGGEPENVPETSETIQGAAMSIPALLQRAQLGTVDPSGFLRFNDPSLYDAPGHYQYDKNGRLIEHIDESLLDVATSPTFGDDFAGASAFVEAQKDQVKGEMAAHSKKHEESEQEKAPETPKDVQKSSEADHSSTENE